MTQAERKCRKCGTAISPIALEGLCPKCLLKGAFGADIAGSFAPGENQQEGASDKFWGNYELLEEIARGGMGKVYRARQINLRRIVAVKVLLHGEFTSDAFVKRFWSEAEAAASLQHPNIVAIHEIGTHQGQPFFSMDYITGKNLSDTLKEKSLSPRKAASYLKLIADAISHAHERGILHRDLKPSNILIDSAGQPHITDFGLARQMNGRSTSLEDHLIGSPNYMPPEQAC